MDTPSRMKLHFQRSIFVICALFVLFSSCEQKSSSSHTPSATGTSTPTVAILLQKPLHLPKVLPDHLCPVSPAMQVVSQYGIAIGNGPVYAAIGLDQPSQHPSMQFADAQHYSNGQSQGWGGTKVLWFVHPSYHGPLLIRGAQLDNSHQIRFDDGLLSEIALDIPQGDSHQWFERPSETRLQVPGCYAYQVDGAHFSQVLIFQARVKNS